VEGLHRWRESQRSGKYPSLFRSSFCCLVCFNGATLQSSSSTDYASAGAHQACTPVVCLKWITEVECSPSDTASEKVESQSSPCMGAASTDSMFSFLRFQKWGVISALMATSSSVATSAFMLLAPTYILPLPPALVVLTSRAVTSTTP
jgi:hypothetical protein